MLRLMLGLMINRCINKMRDLIHFNLEQEDNFNLLAETEEFLLMEEDA